VIVYNLRECPFCMKREAEMHRYDDDAFVSCSLCLASGPVIPGEALATDAVERLAAQAWNRVERKHTTRGVFKNVLERLHAALSDI
jgi:hypothetical protein